MSVPFYHCCYSFFIWHVVKAFLSFLLIRFSPASCPFWCRRGAASLRLVCCCALVCSYSFVYGAMPQKWWIAVLVSPVIILLFAFVFVFVGSFSAVLPYQKKKRENRIPSFLPCLCKHTSLVHWQFSLFYWCAVAEPRFLNSAALLFPCFERKWLTYAQAHCHNLLLWVFLFLFAIITSVLAFFFFCDARGALSSDSMQSYGALKLHARFRFSYILHSMERKRVIMLVKPSLRLFISFFF